uniref:Uncharacterized protein n=1 Tax=Amphimedon queenslandica TaxID=400682 RepID=A0A1X7SMQ2_AMPQE
MEVERLTIENEENEKKREHERLKYVSEAKEREKDRELERFKIQSQERIAIEKCKSKEKVAKEEAAKAKEEANAKKEVNKTLDKLNTAKNPRAALMVIGGRTRRDDGYNPAEASRRGVNITQEDNSLSSQSSLSSQNSDGIVSINARENAPDDPFLYNEAQNQKWTRVHERQVLYIGVIFGTALHEYGIH